MKSLVVGVAVICGFEALIMLVIGAIPPTLTVHWILLGIGFGLPLLVLSIGVVFGLVMNRLGVKPPTDVEGHMRQQSSVQLHSGLPGSTGYKGDHE